MNGVSIMGIILRVFLCAEGIGILFRILGALARRKMVEVYSVSWEFFAIFLILAGILIHPRSLERYIGWPFFWVLLCFLIIGIEGMLRITEHLSEFLRKSTELEMQVSLLNEENYRLKKKLEKMRKVKENGNAKEEAAVCDQYDGPGRRGTDAADAAETN